MNRELQENIQAWVDGELDASQTDRIAALSQSDPAVRDLAQNLRAFQSLLRDHPPEPKLDASREFYWSRIRQAIERSEATASQTPTPSDATRSDASRWTRWLAWIVPASAIATAALFALRPGSLPGPTTSPSTTPVLVEHVVETPIPEVTTVTFYSSHDAMTIVWVGQADIF